MHASDTAASRRAESRFLLMWASTCSGLTRRDFDHKFSGIFLSARRTSVRIIMEREDLLAFVEQGLSLDAIGERVGRSPSTISYWLTKHGLRANGAMKFAPRGELSREILEPLVERGLTIAQIAAELKCSAAMVRRWLSRHELSTRAARNREAARPALAAGDRKVVLDCVTHGSVDHVLEGRGSYRCARCRSERVSEHRRKVKRILVSEAGGSCALCGYRRCPAALEFHHRDPAAKEFHLSLRGLGRSLDDLRTEACKCILLCANCHAEVEVGFRHIPAALTPSPDLLLSQ